MLLKFMSNNTVHSTLLNSLKSTRWSHLKLKFYQFDFATCAYSAIYQKLFCKLTLFVS